MVPPGHARNLKGHGDTEGTDSNGKEGKGGRKKRNRGKGKKEGKEQGGNESNKVPYQYFFFSLPALLANSSSILCGFTS